MYLSSDLVSVRHCSVLSAYLVQISRKFRNCGLNNQMEWVSESLLYWATQPVQIFRIWRIVMVTPSAFCLHLSSFTHYKMLSFPYHINRPVTTTTKQGWIFWTTTFKFSLVAKESLHLHWLIPLYMSRLGWHAAGFNVFDHLLTVIFMLWSMVCGLDIHCTESRQISTDSMDF